MPKIDMAVRFEREKGDWGDLRKPCIACIGPVTSAAAERRGLQVHVMSQDHTLPALIESLERYYRDSNRLRTRSE